MDPIPSPPTTQQPQRARSMLAQLAHAAGILFILTLLTGVAYPLAITGIVRVTFPSASRGSLVVEGNKAIASRLIGQSFEDPKYFWGRLSATTPAPYNAQNSAGSNLGPTNPDLRKNAEARIAALRASDPDNHAAVPVDLVTASASGLDPHISPAAAEYQIARVARMRGLSPERVRELVRAHTEGRGFGVLGEARVNVVLLNLALDGMK
ncbi:MAG: potassium-transporting ATPase subunit KdpC [Polyangiaceae bacterium]|nr:potassium-transporting ATPase subunit KdpC [Polyangiaceae bacterium]